MLNITDPSAEHIQDTAEQVYKRVELTAAAIRLGIGVDGVRRRLQRGTLRGVKEEGKWFVLLPAEELQDNAEHLNQSAEQMQDNAEQRYTSFIEAENARLWKELEERRREVSELHILLRHAQERSERVLLSAPTDYVDTGPAEQKLNNTSHRPFWKRLFAKPT
jgi:hypothetical protein